MADGENQDDLIGRTLWGDPVYRVKRTRGRPPFEWTEENSFKVSLLLSAGWNNDRIAGTILDPRTGKAISVPTLKRHFRSELAVREHARDQLFAKQLMTAAASAFAGNVGAQRLLQQLIEKNDMALADARLRGAQKDAEDEPEKDLGKKETAKRAAAKVAAGEGEGAWGDLLKPDVYQ